MTSNPPETPRCTICGTELVSGANWWRCNSQKRYYKCIDCCKGEKIVYYKNNQERLTAACRVYYSEHKDKMNAQSRVYQAGHYTEISNRKKIYYVNNRAVIMDKRRNYRRLLKIECINGLGGVCADCGESYLDFLTAGHEKDGEGAKQRKDIFGNKENASSWGFYSYLIKHNFKTSFPVRVECFNCNNAKRHVSTKKAEVILAYGGKCTCCGETRIERLTLGHPNSDGKEHRILVGNKSGDSFYTHLKQMGYPSNPDGFIVEVECWNCNMGTRFNGGICPHKRESRH